MRQQAQQESVSTADVEEITIAVGIGERLPHKREVIAEDEAAVGFLEPPETTGWRIPVRLGIITRLFFTRRTRLQANQPAFLAFKNIEDFIGGSVKTVGRLK